MAITSASRLRSLLLPAVALAASACGNPPTFLAPGQAGSPAGILGGTVTYSGPLPCTENGNVLGEAVFLAFDARLLPPPDGLGTTAASLAALGGDQLFGGIEDRLTFNPKGNLWCPAATDPPVTVSGNWISAPARRPVRGPRLLQSPRPVQPRLQHHQAPSPGRHRRRRHRQRERGALGAEPVYRVIDLGVLDPTTGIYEIPSSGSNIDGIAVTLGEALPLGLPIFNPTEVLYSSKLCKSAGQVVTAPSQPAESDRIHDGLRLLAAVLQHQSDGHRAVDPPHRAHLRRRAPRRSRPPPPAPQPSGEPGPTVSFSWPNRQFTAASSLVPALFPDAIFSKLASVTDDLTAQATPAVILQGVTIYRGSADHRRVGARHHARGRDPDGLRGHRRRRARGALPRIPPTSAPPPPPRCW